MSTEHELIPALRKWRWAEKRHAMMVLGEIPSDQEKKDAAREFADRALHEVRKLADDVDDSVVVSLRTAELVRRVFVPQNPNKMRRANPEVVAAAHDFISAYNVAAMYSTARAAKVVQS